MAELIPNPLRLLCRLEDIPDGGAKGFPPASGAFMGLLAVRQGDGVQVYVTSCPQLGVPLDWAPVRFLSADGSHIVCAMHGAVFQIEDGHCIRGPCHGDRLERVRAEIRDGAIWVPADAGL